MKVNYTIGNEYRYAGSYQRFKLIDTSGDVFWFACGHWCTDTVFKDLIDCKTGKTVAENNQLQIQFNEVENESAVD